ncbi:MAG: hypothetical protein IT428_23055 [Planctomycetaceae bacterium]|nr:hypothetical protein [Planctomycetaceae bacterium]
MPHFALTLLGWIFIVGGTLGVVLATVGAGLQVWFMELIFRTPMWCQMRLQRPTIIEWYEAVATAIATQWWGRLLQFLNGLVTIAMGWFVLSLR